MSPSEPQSGWWDLLPFTAHDIEVVPGVETRPGTPRPSDDRCVGTLVDACGGSVEGRRILDLGSLEGGFTLAFAALGTWAVDLRNRVMYLARSVADDVETETEGDRDLDGIEGDEAQRSG